MALFKVQKKIKYSKSKRPKVVKAKTRKILVLSKFSVFNSKKFKILREPEARGLLSNLIGVKILILDDLALINTYKMKYKMNAIVNTLSLAEDKFMPEILLKQPAFT